MYHRATPLTKRILWCMIGVGYQKVMNLWGGRVANSLVKSISQNFTKSTLIIWGTTTAIYGVSYALGQINWGF